MSCDLSHKWSAFHVGSVWSQCVPMMKKVALMGGEMKKTT